MTTLYLNYTPDKEPLFRKVEYADDRAVDTARKAMTGKSRIIKVVDYDSLKPDSGKMSVLPVYSSADSETVGDGSESVSAPVSAPVTNTELRNAELKEQNRSNPDNPFTPVSSSASASGSDSGSSSASGSTPDSSSGSSSSSASSGGGTKSKRKTPLGKKMKKTRKSSSVKGNDE
jgi:hypothetical protein